MGLVISSTGISAIPEAIQGIRDFATPSNVSDVCRFLGMANQLSKFSTRLGELSTPIRELLNKGAVWYWGASQEAAFDAIKKELSHTIELAPYHPGRATVIQTDACREGLGAALLQVQDNGDLRIVSAASRALSDTEKRYATIEQEALGIVWACEKFKDYIIGMKVTIRTDHKPLVPLLSSIELVKISARIQRFRMRLMRFHYYLQHVDKANVIPDALSRSIASPSY